MVRTVLGSPIGGDRARGLMRGLPTARRPSRARVAPLLVVPPDPPSGQAVPACGPGTNDWDAIIEAGTNTPLPAVGINGMGHDNNKSTGGTSIMPKLAGDAAHVAATTTQLHAHSGLGHVRARKHGSAVVIESGPTEDPVKHARLVRDTVGLWLLDIADHHGRWDPWACGHRAKR